VREADVARLKNGFRRFEAQELTWQAIEVADQDEARAVELPPKALRIYPDCADALLTLAGRLAPRATLPGRFPINASGRSGS